MSFVKRGGLQTVIPDGFWAPHRHPASGFVFAYVVSSAIRSQVEGEALRVFHVGESWTEALNAQPPRQRQ